MADFALFKRLTLLYFAAASYQRDGAAARAPRAGAGASCCTRIREFGPALRRCVAAVAPMPDASGDPRAARTRLLDDIDRAIEPFDIAGLRDRSRRDWYPVLAADLVAGAPKLGATPGGDRPAARPLRLRGSAAPCGSPVCAEHVSDRSIGPTRPATTAPELSPCDVRVEAPPSAVGLALAASLAARPVLVPPRRPIVPEATYREAVTAFHTALAAIQTSQEVAGARRSSSASIALVPQEPAGWANLGLLLLRQQEIGPARSSSTKAAELAPENAAHPAAAGARREPRGNSAEAIRALAARPRARRRPTSRRPTRWRWRSSGRATPESDAEAQRVLETLLATQRQPAGAPRRDRASPPSAATPRRCTRALDALAPRRAAWPAAGAGAARRAAPGGRRQPARRRDPRRCS